MSAFHDELFERSSDHHEHQCHSQYSGGQDRILHFDESTSMSDGRLPKSQQTSSMELEHVLAELREMRKRLASIERRPGITDPRSPSEALEAIDEDTTHPVQVEIRERDWNAFINKNARDQEVAIEVMTEEPDYVRFPNVSFRTSRKSDRRDAFFDTNTGTPTESRCSSLPERIRINSPHILNALCMIDKSIEPTEPLVMTRPYKFLHHHERKIREIAKRDTDEGYHVQCFTKFIDQYVQPTVEKTADTKNLTVRFGDLWYLFQPGVTIFMPLKTRGRSVNLQALRNTQETFQNRYETIWKVTSVSGGRLTTSVSQGSKVRLKFNPFEINCYYIDFDGKFFMPITHTFTILPFTGERNIESLDMFPIQYLTSQTDIMKDHGENGRKIFDNLCRRAIHHYYVGPTLVVQPCGCPLQSEPLHQEHIESEVIIDFQTTLLKHPSWRPRSKFWKPPIRNRREAQAHYTVHSWYDKKLQTSVNDLVYDDYSIDWDRAVSFRENERIFDPVPTDWLSNEFQIPEENVDLLTARVFAFVLRTRTFAALWLGNLQPIQQQTDSLQSLQLRDNTKETIRALVTTHYRNERRERNLEHDLVRGKGKGTIILLHGAPGVGKSSTAESIAAAKGRPLFQITCGDLGLTPREVEKALKEIFHYAQMWKCILLLDECDVFLSRRTKEDVKHNSLVSVFLRILEFFTGVLFLTTNRVGVLDDAVKSRITWTAYYPPLDEKQTQMIWKTNIRLLERRNKELQLDKGGIMQFAKNHFRTNFDNRATWNGRQIQNAIKVATSLAEWDLLTESNKDKARKPMLLPIHFETIAKGAHAFHTYLRETHGLHEDERAWDAYERADDFHGMRREASAASTKAKRNNRSPAPGHTFSPEPSHRKYSNTLLSPISMDNYRGASPKRPQAATPVHGNTFDESSSEPDINRGQPEDESDWND